MYGIKTLLDQRRDHVGSFRRKGVAWSIDVNWHQVYGIESVLRTIRLCLYEQHLLRDPIRRIGFLRVTILQTLF